MASSSISLFGARKINLKTQVIDPTDGRDKYAYTRVNFQDGNGSDISDVSAFQCNGITIEDADNLDVFFVKNAEGKTRLEIGLSDSALGIGDVERTDAKTILDSTQE